MFYKHTLIFIEYEQFHCDIGNSLVGIYSYGTQSMTGRITFQTSFGHTCVNCQCMKSTVDYTAINMMTWCLT